MREAMHDCQKFRENLTDWILGRELPDLPGEVARELNSCRSCSSFYVDARTVAKIVASAGSPPPQMSDEYWTGFNTRLRTRLIEEQNQHRGMNFLNGGLRQWAGLAVAASVLLAISGWMFLRTHTAELEKNEARGPLKVEILDDHISGLDPATVDYLSQSELFLRTF